MSADWTGNADSVWKTLGASSHTDKERELHDYYATSPVAIDRLLTVEKPYQNIWECAVGGGHLAIRLQEHGYNVFGSDIVDRGWPNTRICDFLAYGDLRIGDNGLEVVGGGIGETPPFKSYDILTNPPYKYATEFVLKALELVPEGRKVYMFLKLTFLEGIARYEQLFSKYPPKAIYAFSERISCSKNGQEDFYHGAVAYAWYVWEKGYTGKTTVDWI